MVVLKPFMLFIACSLAIVSLSECKKPKKVKVAPTPPTSEVKENTIEDQEVVRSDPCATHKCGAGRSCIIDKESQEARCNCVSECSDNADPRRRVCPNHNTTWQSDCHLQRHRCLCIDGLSEDCTDEHKHMHIDYYGECHEIAECTKEILEDFPRRMREWLYNIMSYKSSKRSSGDSDSESGELVSKWVDAVIWKYCDLDKHPHDRFVSRHELFPLRAPLLSMEPCISNFLNSCDPDDDHKITLKEWGQCLGAPDGELEDKCTQFKALISEDDFDA